MKKHENTSKKYNVVFLCEFCCFIFFYILLNIFSFFLLFAKLYANRVFICHLATIHSWLYYLLREKFYDYCIQIKYENKTTNGFQVRKMVFG